MKPRMHVISTKNMGHIVAVYTRRAAPEAMPTVADLVGAALPLRREVPAAPPPTLPLEFQIPADRLDVTVVDFDAAVVRDPLNFVVTGTTVSVCGGPPPLPTFPALPVLANELVVPINVPAVANPPGAGPPLPNDLEVWVQLVEQAVPKPQRSTMFEVIPRGTNCPNDHHLPLTFPPGGLTLPLAHGKVFDYLLLRAGFAPLIGTVTVP